MMLQKRTTLNKLLDKSNLTPANISDGDLDDMIYCLMLYSFGQCYRMRSFMI